MTGIILVDKPEGWTSHDVVAKLRGVLGESRIGHGGTLDPMATGLLPVFVGRATRAVEFSVSVDKEYVAGLRLGMTTDTQDITGARLTHSEVSVSDGQLREALRHFTGEQTQIPPMYSAIKVGGKRLYELARSGIEVERQPRLINVRSIELAGCVNGEYYLRVVCSKGTYVRTLCADIGGHLGCGGVMSSLRRTRVGTFGILASHELGVIEGAMKNGEIDKLLLPVDTLFYDMPAAMADEACEHRCKSGARYACPEIGDGRYRVYSEGSGEFLMLGDAKDGYMKIGKTFFEVPAK
ncbi:MAG: tRNA pseudouridine(55) synthase TruB [Oscillospiraceae bacterium]|jgi:tRNA pseudouridine55 synthase|nr:tRNA pseudouridine(55) synthase TruB [Oscillospiraceae bacterium]